MAERAMRDASSVTTEDEQLVQGALAGDKSAFESLVKRHEKNVFSLGMSFFHNTADSRDF
jgi:hypothetical protein